MPARFLLVISFLFHVVAFSSGLLLAQPRVDQRNMHERIIVAVPMVGSGTYDDPKRPLFAPVAGAAEKSGILSYSYVMADDGQTAIVEFVARDRAAFQSILSDRAHNLRVFEKGRHSRAEIEVEMKRLKKDFDLEKFGAANALGGGR